jgi:hypothetical protein
MKRFVLLVLATSCQQSITALPDGKCADNLTACGSQCVDIRLDNTNCGTCGKSCSNIEGCAASTCFASSCTDFSCGQSQVCPSGNACIERTCVGVNCGTSQVCVAGVCQPESCGATPCPMGQACVREACTDVNCVGITCPSGRVCVRGACVNPMLPGAGLSGFSSGSSLGNVMSNGSHKNLGVLGDSTPPSEAQTNGTHTNQPGQISNLR